MRFLHLMSRPVWPNSVDDKTDFSVKQIYVAVGYCFSNGDFFVFIVSVEHPQTLLKQARWISRPPGPVSLRSEGAGFFDAA